MNPVYMIGVGPGDPELVTVKAVRLMKEADIVYVPESSAGGRSVAEQIIRPYVEKEKMHLSYFPMTNDYDELDKRYTELAAEIAEQVKAGKKLVYVTLGDAMLYSTAQYVSVRLRKMGIEPVFIPGITSYNACANLTGISLADKSEQFTVLGIPDSVEELKKLCDSNSSVVLMKISKRLPVLLEYVKTYKPRVATLTRRATLEGEEVIDLTKADGVPEDAGYLSVAIIKQ